jgi:hypothetical protein
VRRTMTILAIASVLNGCAFTDIPLTLPSGGLDNAISGGNQRQVVIIMPFSDERAIRGRCGMQKNGYNMDTADAICQSDPTLWIANLLADGLRASGFLVLDADADHRPTALRVDGALLKIFVEPVIGAWTGSLEADLSVKLQATTETGLRAERTFFVKGWKGGQLASTSQPYQTSLHRATQAILEEMVRAITELMDEYPQLGWRESDLLRMALRVEEAPR